MRPQTVLIVDDEPEIRRVVGEILRDEGLHIETAENADVAREKYNCLLYTSPSPRDLSTSRMPSSA